MEEDEVVRRYVDINEDDIHFLHNEEDELYNFDDDCGYENAPPVQHHPHIRFPINIWYFWYKKKFSNISEML